MISQQTFLIPPEIQAGLAVGDLVQYGGIVRNQAGQIVQHLKAIDLPVNCENFHSRWEISPWVGTLVPGVEARASRSRRSSLTV